MKKMLKRISSFYQEASQILLTTALLFIFLNFVAMMFVSKSENELKAFTPEIPLLWSYTMDQFKKGYPDWDESKIMQFIVERTAMDFTYDPFIQFKPKAQQGTFFNIAETGGRQGIEKVIWPPPIDRKIVLFFGGSTAFSISVPDKDTIPARLEQYLREVDPSILVYNLGVPSHYSSLERIHLEYLLLHGIRPQIVVFFDGLNDFYYYDDKPSYTDLLSTYVDGLKKKKKNISSLTAIDLTQELTKRIPIINLGLRWLDPKILADQASRNVPSTDRDLEEKDIRPVLKRLKTNYETVEALGRQFGFKVLEVIQPVPTYGYDLKNHAFFNGKEANFFAGHIASQIGYPLMKAEWSSWSHNLNVLWLGDIQMNRSDNLYIDSVHYTVKFSDEIAKAIAAKATLLL